MLLFLASLLQNTLSQARKCGASERCSHTAAGLHGRGLLQYLYLLNLIFNLTVPRCSGFAELVLGIYLEAGGVEEG